MWKPMSDKTGIDDCQDGFWLYRDGQVERADYYIDGVFYQLGGGLLCSGITHWQPVVAPEPPTKKAGDA